MLLVTFISCDMYMTKVQTSLMVAGATRLTGLVTYSHKSQRLSHSTLLVSFKGKKRKNKTRVKCRAMVQLK